MDYRPNEEDVKTYNVLEAEEVTENVSQLFIRVYTPLILEIYTLKKKNCTH